MHYSDSVAVIIDNYRIGKDLKALPFNLDSIYVGPESVESVVKYLVDRQYIRGGLDRAEPLSYFALMCQVNTLVLTVYDEAKFKPYGSASDNPIHVRRNPNTGKLEFKHTKNQFLIDLGESYGDRSYRAMFSGAARPNGHAWLGALGAMNSLDTLSREDMYVYYKLVLMVLIEHMAGMVIRKMAPYDMEFSKEADANLIIDVSAPVTTPEAMLEYYDATAAFTTGLLVNSALKHSGATPGLLIEVYSKAMNRPATNAEATFLTAYFYWTHDDALVRRIPIKLMVNYMVAKQAGATPLLPKPDMLKLCHCLANLEMVYQMQKSSNNSAYGAYAQTQPAYKTTKEWITAIESIKTIIRLSFLYSFNKGN